MSNPSNSEQNMLSEARAEVVQADQKASLILATVGIGFSAVFAGLIAGEWTPARLNGWFSEVLWWVGAAAAIASIAMAAAAVWPRFHAYNPTTGVHFWGDVASFDEYQDFADEMTRNPPSHAERNPDLNSGTSQLSSTTSTGVFDGRFD